MDLFIKNVNEYDENEIMVMLALNSLYNSKYNMCITSYKAIGYFLTSKVLSTKNRNERTLIDKIKAGVKSLCKKEIL